MSGLADFNFIGHSFHRRTGSSAFFLSLLRRLGSVREFWTSPDEPMPDDFGLLKRLVDAKARTYIFWQTEHIARRLINIGLGRFILIPMHDAAAGLASSFWKAFVDADIISFSRSLHEQLRALECRSHAFRFFPAIPQDAEVRSVQGPRTAFFWERRPDQRPNLASVLRLCEALQVRRLHVHQAPDFAHRPCHPEPRQAGAAHEVEITLSTWSDQRAEAERLAGGPLIYFAPRLMEGIGMASLEAMARGQVVVAPDRPTMNEYLADGVSGLLYDLDALRLPEVGDGQLCAMSRAALRKARFMRAEWEADQDRLTSILSGDGRRWSGSDHSSGFTNCVRRAARDRAWASA